MQKWKLKGDLASFDSLGCEGALGQAVKVRPRALMTTMFARLFLGDWFVHGAGGAKYDRLTDRLIEAFFGMNATKYAAITATFHLPVAVPQEGLADYRRVIHQLRELRFHPECYLDSPDERCRELIEQKRVASLQVAGSQ